MRASNSIGLVYTLVSALFVFTVFKVFTISFNRFYKKGIWMCLNDNFLLETVLSTLRSQFCHFVRKVIGMGIFPNTRKPPFNNTQNTSGQDLMVIQLGFFHRKHSLERPIYLETAHKCMAEGFRPFDNRQYWENFSRVVNNCTEVRNVRIANLDNSDERKHFQLPARYESNPFIKECTVITLGIGHDIQSEQKLRDQFPHCLFYGVDPMEEINKDLYTSIGKYFHIAVGGSNGEITTDVLDGASYKTATVQAIDLTSFLKTNIDRKVVDVLWVDIENSEYDMFPLLLQSGAPYKAGYRFCQINLEVHAHLNNETTLAKYADYVKSMLKENQFTVFHSMQSVHIRTFLVNHKDDECFERFFETTAWDGN